jgi:long-chain acyl-CoA synthetase
MLRKSLAANPAKAAIVQGERRVSYFDLERAVGEYAAFLKQAGVEQGDTVAVVLPNCPEFVISLFAIARLRAVMLPVNPEYPREEMRKFLTDRPPKVVITDTLREQKCGDERVVLIDREAMGAYGEEAGTTGMFEGSALYLYTSGSTDTWKRISCSQRNLYFEAHNFVESTGIGADDTILCTLPLYHSYGMGNCLLDAVYTGATLVLEPDSDAPFAARYAQVLRLLVEEKVCFYPGVPFQFEVLAAAPEDIGAAFANVRWCVSSGDVLPKRTFDRFLARTGQPIRSLYGSTEAGSICMDTRPAPEVRFGSLGEPLRNVEIAVRGEAGHIWVKSPAVFCDGFYDTGDLGRLDDGRLVMTGRKQTFFDVGGHKVDLGEVEEVLLLHPLVREAAAVGIEIPKIGGVIKAVVAVNDVCREGDVLDHCRKHLAAYKIPRLVEFREMLPRSPLGKVLRKELADPASWLVEVPSAREVPEVSRVQQIDWLAQRIREQVATILQCEPAEVPRDVPFQSLGFDSLRAVELRERLSRMSGVALSITTLFNYTSVDAYAAFLLDAMRGPAQERDQLNGFTDDEIARMLAKELSS